MKKLLFSACLLVSFASTSFAQIGITATYANANAKEWERTFQLEVEDDRQLFISGTRVGVNYWFRLKNVRIEFLPSFEYAVYGTWTDNAPDRSEFDLSSWGGFVHTRFYLFDFANDCNCPTFSKQNQLFKKGFFVSLSPGVERFTSSRTVKENGVSTVIAASEWKASGGVGVGLDLGISDFLTVTPIAGISYAQDLNGSHLFNSAEPNVPSSDLMQYYAGINIGLRFNQ